MRTIHRLGIAAAICLGAIAQPSQRSQKDPDLDKLRTIWSGPCWGQVGIATTFGKDQITLARIRELLRSKLLQPCFDNAHPQDSTKKDYVIYSDVDQRDAVFKAVFTDDECKNEVLSLIVYVPEWDLPLIPGPWEIAPSLPDKHWVWKGRPKLSSVSATDPEGATALGMVIISNEYSRICKGRVPDLTAIVKRHPVYAWGKSCPFDLYFQFNTEWDRFQKFPVGPVVFSGRVDPSGVPFIDPSDIRAQ